MALLVALTMALSACSDAEGGIVAARRHATDYGISAVTFRTLDSFFPTAGVARGDQVSPLPASSDKTLSLQTRLPLDGSPTLANRLHASHTNAFIVVQHGATVLEAYFNGAHASDRFIGWSLSKSVLGLLYGAALRDGAIKSLQDPAERYYHELAGTAFEGISIQNLLRMRDGVDYEERAWLLSSDLDALVEQSLYRGERPFTDFSQLNLKRTAKPGETFNYSTLTSGILGRILEEATGTSLAAYTSQALWQPAGMEANAYWLLDGPPKAGRAFAGGGLGATARDFARIGLLVLQGGALDGKRILPEAWVQEATRHIGDEPVLPRSPRGYGYHFWTLLNTHVVDAVGVYGQWISIDPDTQTVIVKLSHWPGPGADPPATVELLGAIRKHLRATTVK